MSKVSTPAQEEFVPVAKMSDVPEGSMIGVAISGKPILVSRVGDKLYAMDAVCSHLYGYLPSGELRNNMVICPVHKAQYDVATGKVIKNVPALMRLASGRQATDLHTYDVEVIGDSIRIKI